MLQRILVPLDGSSRAEQALPIAARIAHTTGGSVILLTVANIPTEYTFSLYSSYLSQTPFFADDILEIELEKARQYLSIIAESETLKGIKTETETSTGATAQTILDVAEKEHIDLIIICSHGETGFKRWALGSVAQKVARHSPVPVLVLREGSLEPVALHLDAAHPLRALVTLDGSSLAEFAIVPAAYLVASLAAPAQGSLHLAQVVNLPAVQVEDESAQHKPDLREQAERKATTYLSNLANALSSELGSVLGLEITWSVVVSEDVADALIRMAELGEKTGSFEIKGCDLVAIATHGRGGFQRWMLGSITERILDGTKLPLLIVRPQQQQ
jgi:nucleotide-binding universal stress UspA family protein